ncbi:MAG: Mini-ribonuclease 3 [Clostridia bacterium]|nr:Mini-ribonuclease 3 [Clostridia bacterium]
MMNFFEHSDLKYDSQQMNATVLAYIGDSVYELFVRTLVVQSGGKVNTMHKQSVEYVKASSQALALQHIADELDDKEAAIVRRARNSKNISVPKNASHTAYRQATGFEALLGYLFLLKKEERLEYLMTKSVRVINPNLLEGK